LRGSEWGVFSQNGEDGILAALFGRLGTTSRAFVEFGVEDGAECNTRLLREARFPGFVRSERAPNSQIPQTRAARFGNSPNSQIHDDEARWGTTTAGGWSGLLMDGAHERAEIGLRRAVVTPDNVGRLFAEADVPPEIDLLVVDIDYDDFWVWRAILEDGATSARVAVVEVNSHAGPRASAVVARGPDDMWEFRAWDGSTARHGASVTAMERLGRRHGYTMVYCESHGVNCFFVRDDVLADGLGLADAGLAALRRRMPAAELHRPPNHFGMGLRHAADAPGAWAAVRPDGSVAPLEGALSVSALAGASW
jgi:hypothetical protein